MLREAREVGRDAVRRDAVEIAGVAVPRDLNESAARAGDLSEPAAGPRRKRPDRVVGAVEQPRAHHEGVGGDDLDELRAGAVRGLGDRDGQLPVLGVGLDDEGVALLDPERGPDDRVGVAREGLGRE